jgi:hypothetical protein
MKKLCHRIMYFFTLWRGDYYGERIDAAFAWDLADALADHHDELSQWSELK